MKRVLFLVLGLLILLLAVASIAPFLVPNEVYRAQIEKAATNALGRDVTLAGDVGISVFPRISASVEGVTVKNPEEFTAENMVEAGALRGTVKWGPLLARRVEVQEIAFVDATVQLERLEDGSANWSFGSGETDAEPDTTEPSGGLSAGVEKARLVNTALYFNDAMTGQSYALSDFTAEASLQALDKPLSARGEGIFQDQRFDFDVDVASLEAALAGTPTETSVTLKTDLADISYDGTVGLGDAPVLDGAFSASADNLAALAAFVDVDLPVDLSALGSFETVGKASGDLASPTLTFDRLTLNGALADLGYVGGINLANGPVLDGRFTVDATDLGRYLLALGIDLPAASVLETLDLSTDVSGGIEALSLSNAKIQHNGALLDASFAGDLALGGSMSGKLSASSDDLRGLLTTAGVELSPGDTLRRFSLSAKPSGTLSTLSLADLDLSLDDISATGSGGVDLSGSRPKLTATLSMPRLDASPFLGGGDDPQPNQNSSGGWSKAALNLAALKALDASLDLNVGTLILGDLTLTDADLTVTLTDGDLNANLAQVTAFGGLWKGLVGLDASGTLPALAVDLNGSSVVMSDMLSTFAGLDSIDGLGQLSVKATSTGESLDALVNGLNGSASANLADGAIKGFNAAQLVRSASDIRSALASGDFNLALSPSAETDFTAFDTVLTIRDGVANVDVLKLLNPIVQLDGSGVIDLGAQALDLSLATSFDKAAGGDASTLQLNGIPVPVRLSGRWISPSISPDTRLLQQALTNQLRDEAASEISDRLGAELGEGLSGVLGLPARETPDAESAAPEGDESVSEDKEETVEDRVEDAARDALSDLFRRDD